MKLTVLLLLVGAALAERRRTPEPVSDQTAENTSKRALVEGNVGVEKRTPVLPTAQPAVTTGVEYATTNQPLSQKTQEYVGGLPERLRPAVVKISDLLAGQGAFPNAIHNQLYSPVSPYQNRLVNQQTYEVSAPVPSQLAYSEHKISYQPSQYKQNNYQSFQQLLPPEQVIFSHQAGNYNRPVYPQRVAQPPRFTYNHVPQVQPAQYRPSIIYSNTHIRNPPQIQNHNFIQQIEPQILPTPQQQYNNNYYKSSRTYFPQEQAVLLPQGTGVPSVEVVQSLEPGINYAAQEERPQLTQREPQEAPVRAPEKQNVNTQPNQFHQPQGAVSYASFSVGPPAPVNHVPQSTLHAVQQQPAQAPYNPPSYQPLVGIVAPQQYQQPFQFHPLIPKPEPQFIQNIEPQPIRNLPQSPRLSYFRPGLSLYRNFYSPDSFQTQNLVLQNPSVPSQSLSPITLPPVQFFGKFAHSIFGSQYQPQQQKLEQQQVLQQQQLQPQVEQQQQYLLQQPQQQLLQQPQQQVLQQPQQQLLQQPQQQVLQQPQQSPQLYQEQQQPHQEQQQQQPFQQQQQQLFQQQQQEQPFQQQQQQQPFQQQQQQPYQQHQQQEYQRQQQLQQ